MITATLLEKLGGWGQAVITAPLSISLDIFILQRLYPVNHIHICLRGNATVIVVNN